MTAPLPVTRARRVVLTVGLPVLLALIGVMSYNAVALSDQASYRVHVSVPARDGQTGSRSTMPTPSSAPAPATRSR